MTQRILERSTGVARAPLASAAASARVALVCLLLTCGLAAATVPVTAAAAGPTDGTRCTGEVRLCRSVHVRLYPQWRHAGENGWSFSSVEPLPSWSVRPRPGPRYWFALVLSWPREGGMAAGRTVRARVTMPGIRLAAGQGIATSGGSMQVGLRVNAGSLGAGSTLFGRVLPGGRLRSCPSVVLRAGSARALYRPICFPLR